MDNKQKVSTESYKGVRDFYPEDMKVQNYIFSVWRKIAEEFNYQEYTASILEYADLYKAKGERNEEIVNEQMYVFKDKGDREVALRPEMTPTLARMVAARRKGLKLPLRWYSIPNCFRYERPQRGRRREHWQLNCDIMGVSGIEAEVEIISLAHKIMKEFGAKDEDFEIRINNRSTIKRLLEEAGINDEEKKNNYLSLLDKKSKMTEDEFKNEEIKLIGSNIKFETSVGNVTEEIISGLGFKGIKNIKFDPGIVRGFNYYTGMVFEVYDTNPENRRALFGGGRYDNLLEMFGVEPLPTVGFGMGDVTIRDFLETHNLPIHKLN